MGLLPVNKRSDRRTLEPKHELVDEMEYAGFDETELKEILARAGVQEAGTREFGVGTWLQVRKIARKIPAQEEGRRGPRITGAEHCCNGLGSAHPVGARPINPHVEGHLDIYIEFDGCGGIVRRNDFPAATFRMAGCGSQESLRMMAEIASGHAAAIRAAARAMPSH